ncbi:hypothetical protein [Achromobacter sp. NFACC18-2]|uniref:hypothetical protein n=1 Tax=Achromobacter sp. NFACC18-2 TaxID=1564112 RepID=UPI0015871041|nr:hypothetical protein [Achromobacter sp. NFACC18-2]
MKTSFYWLNFCRSDPGRSQERLATIGGCYGLKGAKRFVSPSLLGRLLYDHGVPVKRPNIERQVPDRRQNVWLARESIRDVLDMHGHLVLRKMFRLFTHHSLCLRFLC